MEHLSTVKDVARALWSDGKGKVLAFIAVGWGISAGVRLVYPALLPHIRDTYELDLTAAGLLLTVLWLAYAFGQFPGGIIADWIGGGKTLAVSMAMSAVALVLVTTAVSALVLFIATTLVGFATAFYGVSRYTILDDIYTEQYGLSIGLTSAMGDVGNSLLPPIAGFLTAALVWQLGFGFMIPLFLLVSIGILLVVPSQTSDRERSVDTISLENTRYLLSELHKPSITVATAIQCLGVCIWQAFTGFYPTYLIEVKELSPTVATSLFGLFFALGVVIKPLSGRAYDQLSARRSLAVVFLVSGIGFLLLPFVEGFWALLGVTILVSPTLGRGTITLAYITTSIPDDIQNTGFGLLRTGYFIIAALSPVLFGAIADRGHFDEAFLLLGVLTAVVLYLTTKIPSRAS